MQDHPHHPASYIKKAARPVFRHVGCRSPRPILHRANASAPVANGENVGCRIFQHPAPPTKSSTSGNFLGVSPQSRHHSRAQKRLRPTPSFPPRFPTAPAAPAHPCGRAPPTRARCGAHAALARAARHSPTRPRPRSRALATSPQAGCRLARSSSRPHRRPRARHKAASPSRPRSPARSLPAIRSLPSARPRMHPRLPAPALPAPSPARACPPHPRAPRRLSLFAPPPRVSSLAAPGLR